jgi:hypothetical protein
LGDIRRSGTNEEGTYAEAFACASGALEDSNSAAVAGGVNLVHELLLHRVRREGEFEFPCHVGETRTGDSSFCSFY